jgi:hypothetical protein
MAKNLIIIFIIFIVANPVKLNNQLEKISLEIDYKNINDDI